VTEKWWKQLPFWILIAINVPAIYGIGKGLASDAGAGSGMGDFLGMIIPVAIIALIVFDVIYLYVWSKARRE